MDLGTDTRRQDRGATPGADRRRRRWGRRAAQRVGLVELFADLAAGEPKPPEPEVGIDPAERALLIELYRELVGTVEGPVVPFPVELMENPALVDERPEAAPLLDLSAFRARRAAVDGPPTGSGGTPEGGTGPA